MDEEKRLLFIKEQYYPYKDMSYTERDMCLDYLSKIKDNTDSITSSIKEFKIVSCTFKKDDNGAYSFSGFTSNKEENRCILGDITINDDKIVIKCETTRLCVDNGEKIYNTIDIFNKLEDNTYHQTSVYSFGNCKYEKNITLKNYDKTKFIPKINEKLK